MEITSLSLRKVFFYVGLLSVLAPTAAYADVATSQSMSTAQLVAQTASQSYQQFKSQRLGFRFEYPNDYKVDTSSEAQGRVILRNATTGATTPSAGSDQPAVDNSEVLKDKIIVAEFSNPQGLSALKWAQQNQDKSFFNGRQSDYRSRQFAGQPALSYSWCSTNNNCGDSIIVPDRNGRRIIVLSALYEFPGDEVRWDFQKIAGGFRFVQ